MGQMWRRFNVWIRSNNPPAVNGKHAKFMLLMLLFVYILNGADRTLLPALIPGGLQCPPVNATAPPSNVTLDCISFSDVGTGVLTGPAFTVMYVLAGIPLARLADNFNRVRIIFVGLLLWTTMTLANAVVKEYWQLLLTRIALGIGEATYNPSAFSIISDLFAAEHRATAFSIYHFGVYAGGGVGYLAGVINGSVGWRSTFFIMSLPGFAVALLWILTSNEPTRGKAERDDALSTDEKFTLMVTLKHLWRSHTYRHVCLAAAVRNIAGYALGGYTAVFYNRVHGLDSTQYGIALAVIIPIAGTLSSFLGGYCADRLTLRRVDGKAVVIVLSQLMAVPMIIATLLAPSANASFGCLSLAYLSAETWLGPAAAIVQDVSLPSMRGTATAVYIAFNTLIGSTGSVIIGALLGGDGDDGIVGRKYGYNEAVRYALLFVVPTAYFISALWFMVVAFYLRKETHTRLIEDSEYANLLKGRTAAAAAAATNGGGGESAEVRESKTRNASDEEGRPLVVDDDDARTALTMECDQDDAGADISDVRLAARLLEAEHVEDSVL